MSTNPLTYPRSQKEAFKPDLFASPTAEYRGAPLWSWNGKLQDDKLAKQIEAFADMGFGGFHMHARVGLDTKYLSDDFFHAVKVSEAEASKRSMLTCLYDDDRWPSGCAGGLVTAQNEDFKTKHILVTPYPYGQAKYPPHRIGYGPKGKGARSENGKLVARYDVQVKDDGSASYRRLSSQDPSTAQTWYAYLETNPPADWYNGSTYVDCMNTEATAAFLASTHQKYYECFGEKFGRNVPCIFTDEPQVEHKAVKASSFDDLDCLLPWGQNFGNSFQEAYGYDFFDRLPEFLWDTDSPTSLRTRYEFNDLVTERFVRGFHDTVGEWCSQHGIMMTGHMMMEPSLESQTVALGEAMRCYRKMGLPGIDLLRDKVEFNTAKQAVSVARQNGTIGATCEIYGVTNWTFTFDGHKGCGDWQAALGITFRVHHLSPYTLLGEAKRDYPAAISYQSPWYKEYNAVETYFARLNVALTRGRPVTRVAVIHPVESYWLCLGPRDRNGEEQLGRDDVFKQLSDWLLHGLIDFDFVSESLFPEQTPLESINDNVLKVGTCQYEAVIVPNMRTIRSTTVERLARFAAKGGKVIFTGEVPTLVDAKPVPSVSIAGASQVPFTQYALLNALRSQRDVAITMHTRRFEQPFLYQLRKDGSTNYLFVCNMNRSNHYETTIRVRGHYDVSVLDAAKGETWQAKSRGKDGWTEIDWTFEKTGSVLLQLDAKKISNGVNGHHAVVSQGKDQTVYRKQFKKAGFVALEGVELSDPNVLLLDKASFRIEGQSYSWSEPVEVLRIDNLARERMGQPLKGEGVKQPWAFTAEERKPFGVLQLRFEFECAEDIQGQIDLAAEGLVETTVALDGKQLPVQVNGYFVDEDIKTSAIIPAGSVLSKGKHILELSSPFALASTVERIYLLGKEFGVDLQGERALLRKLDLSELTFEDWTKRGLPFYSGNLTYHCKISCPESVGAAAVQLPEMTGCPVSVVTKAGREPQVLGFHPLIADLGPLEAGEHRISITAFGNCENSFGAIHVPNGKTKWFGPDAWRSEHDWWTDSYNVKPMGLTIRPELLVPGKEIYAAARPTGEPAVMMYYRDLNLKYGVCSKVAGFDIATPIMHCPPLANPDSLEYDL